MRGHGTDSFRALVTFIWIFYVSIVREETHGTQNHSNTKNLVVIISDYIEVVSINDYHIFTYSSLLLERCKDRK